MLSAVVASAFAGLLDSAKTTATTTGIGDICILATDVKVCLASTMTTITRTTPTWKPLTMKIGVASTPRETAYLRGQGGRA